ncbi:hypothetical protein QYE76_010951 [Lolium multiflorum]|uniref:Reverse transcriptase domain-containing protein n=1 Tax=Lolium multiflorum TaxID=4521 RepID=A0AAD8TY69_LOLMU|nr:hypothetical protein QYE76_010951 [Lolium multiflorum]
MNLSAQPLHVICLQESKLSSIPLQKAATFLPQGFSTFSFLPSIGASGGIVTAWDARYVTHLSDRPLQFSLSSTFELAADSTSFTVTNIYAPCDRARRDDFLSEMRSLADLDSDPWLLVGDFNIARYAEDRNNDNFDVPAAAALNDLIDELALQELPLLDRRYTWTNSRDTPTLDGVLTADGFRPISLQNCIMKIVTKILTSRLQHFIERLISFEQSGFVKGRSIVDNFLYAADVVQSCQTRKTPVVVLKLDFKKAFDSVNWAALDAILEARGIGPLFRSWISSILTTGRTAILLNGVPGRWISCKNGLRQGDPLSPYLYLAVADLLPCLIAMESSEERLLHPLVDDLPCPVIQYADDTLLILRAEHSQVRRLKAILDLFSHATGLHINFHKSTFVPVGGVPYGLASELAGILGCPVSSFPQTYLGLPLSDHKL